MQKEIKTLALVGQGGAGKTTLACQYAQSQSYQIIWEINAETRNSFIASFESLALALSRTENEKRIIKNLQEIKDTNEREKILFSFIKIHLKKYPDWLLIFDNVDTFSDIQNYFPCDSRIWGEGKIIVTTRDENIQNNNLINHVIYIDELTSIEKEQLFSSIMEINENDKEKDSIKAFLTHIPSLPLDISIAAYYLKATNISYEQYHENLKLYTPEFSNLQKDILENANKYNKTRYEIISMSVEKLIETDKNFSELLLLISLIDSQNIPRNLIDNFKNKDTTDKFIYNLKKYSLILNIENTDTFSLHRSTQEIILKHLIKVLTLKQKTAFIEKIIDVIEKYIMKIIEKEDFLKLPFLENHCLKLLSHTLLTVSMKGKLYGKVGIIAYYQDNHKKAKFYLENAKKQYDQLNKQKNEDKLNIIQIISYLGDTYRNLGDYEKAKTLLEKSLHYYPEMDPLEKAHTLLCLGNTYRNLGRYKKALIFIKESLLFYEKNHRGYVHALALLGIIEGELGNYNQAQSSFQKSLDEYAIIFPQEPAGKAWVLVYLGDLYRKMENYEEAKKKLMQGLKIHQEQFSQNHTYKAWVLAHLGNTYRDNCDYKKSIKSLQESLSIYEEFSSENPIRFAWVAMHLGDLYREIGNYERAHHFLERSRAIYEKNLPSNHPDIARILRMLGKTYQLKGNYDYAKQLFHKSQMIYENACGKNHPWLAQVFCDLGEVYLIENDFEISKNYMNKASYILRHNHHSDTFRALKILNEKYLKEKNKQQYWQFKVQAIRYLEQIFPSMKFH
ncbi:MAG: tetratricopeptide repeat protein [Candidatus Paracaedimonas acanthamoebae]|uniref:Tetratricopeptide repeat protein n=1 Tax=Candidatus Paracaedimonas acanthamoebae TaxID=244581 RepID=A0A8J7Q1X7_9PROT|nr:tetratricopeptide repeat protein [Candidatus Paracaedimonas acanthamoebae]